LCASYQYRRGPNFEVSSAKPATKSEAPDAPHWTFFKKKHGRIAAPESRGKSTGKRAVALRPKTGKSTNLEQGIFGRTNAKLFYVLGFRRILKSVFQTEVK
jgi:hypothetical protein